MKIQDFNLLDESILITLEGGKEIEVSIPKFETWLDESDKMEWLSDFNDPGKSNGHGQSSGRFQDFDEYYESTKREDFLNDLREYLTEKENSIFETLAQITKPN